MARTKSLSIIERSLAEFSGLRPRAWICLGPGYGREELKSVFFEHGQALGSEVLTRVEGLAARVLGLASGVGDERVLAGPARQEVLRFILSQSSVLALMPEMRRLRRQSGFFRKLDRAVQAGRMAWTYENEREVHEERLLEKVGENQVRTEVQKLAFIYEHWLTAEGLWDPPMLLRAATLRLQSGERPGSALPRTVYRLSAQTPESLERSFWEMLGREIECVDLAREEIAKGARHSAGVDTDVNTDSDLDTDTDVNTDSDLDPPAGASATSPEFHWTRWHTLDDAAEALASHLATLEPEHLAHHTILIPDQTAVRRSMRRALQAHGVPLSDPRDPMRLRFEESLKRALAPLEVVSGRFERRAVIAYAQMFGQSSAEPGFRNSERNSEKSENGASIRDASVGRKESQSLLWVKEIHSRGVRIGLEGYAGGKLTALYAELTRLHDRLGGKLTLADFTARWIEEIAQATWLEESEKRWLAPWLDRLLTEMAGDVARVGLGNRRAPPLFWMERIAERIDQATPPIERSKPRYGVTLSRLGQAPLKGTQHLHLLGLPPQWIAGDGVGDLWYPDRERELLGSEFQLRSSRTVREERVRLLQSWATATDAHLEIWDAIYDWDGRERESLLPLFREAGWLDSVNGEPVAPPAPEDRGAHPRWIASFGSLRPAPPTQVRLPSLLQAGVSRISATELEHMSRCGFTGLAKGRWRLFDLREAEPELWPDVRGNILHLAVQRLLESRDADGNFARDPQSALDEAWQTERPRGLLRGERLEQLARRKMLEVLQAFCEAERDYVSRAHTRVSSLEGPALRWKSAHGVEVTGIPDRIDEHPEGLFILDNKSSSALPKGQDMIGLGYRLQLPFYALAVQEQLGKPVIGLQFVELNRKAGRSSGLFFSQWNGKEEGNLTYARGNSRSLVKTTPEDAWAKIREHVEAAVGAYVDGCYDVKPKLPTECTDCAYRDLCGRNRQAPGDGESEGAEA